MKRKDIASLHQKSVSELRQELEKKRQELTKLLLEKKVKQMKNTRMANTLRDDIARILTVLKLVLEKETKK